MSLCYGANKKAITAITANDGIATRKISAVWGNVGGQKTKLWAAKSKVTNYKAIMALYSSGNLKFMLASIMSTGETMISDLPGTHPDDRNSTHYMISECSNHSMCAIFGKGYNNPSVSIYNGEMSYLAGTNSYGEVRCVVFSHSNNYLAQLGGNGYGITIFKNESGKFEKAILEYGTDGSAKWGCFSLDDNYLYLATTENPFIIAFKRDGDTFTKMSSVSTVSPENSSNYIDICSKNNIIAVAANIVYSGEYHRALLLYTVNSDGSLAYIDNGITQYYSGSQNAQQYCKFSNDGKMLLVGGLYKFDLWDVSSATLIWKGINNQNNYERADITPDNAFCLLPSAKKFISLDKEKKQIALSGDIGTYALLDAKFIK